MVKNNKTTDKPKYDVMPILEHMRACPEAKDWVIEQEHLTFADAWDACPDASWMLWLALVAKVDAESIVLAACDCVEPALQHVPDEEQRPRLAIEAARRWARGEISHGEAHAAAGACLHTFANISFFYYVGDAKDAYLAVAFAAGADVEDDQEFLARSAAVVRARIPWRVMEAKMIEYARNHNCLELAR